MNSAFAHLPQPVTLEGHGVRLVPLSPAHAPGLRAAAADGELWNLRITSVPAPDETESYIAQALQAQAEGRMLCFTVLDADHETILGTTSYHDIVPAVARLEIGHT